MTCGYSLVQLVIYMNLILKVKGFWSFPKSSTWSSHIPRFNPCNMIHTERSKGSTRLYLDSSILILKAWLSGSGGGIAGLHPLSGISKSIGSCQFDEVAS